jgi:hypothetical protein
MVHTLNIRKSIMQTPESSERGATASVTNLNTIVRNGTLDSNRPQQTKSFVSSRLNVSPNSLEFRLHL